MEAWTHISEERFRPSDVEMPHRAPEQDCRKYWSANDTRAKVSSFPASGGQNALIRFAWNDNGSQISPVRAGCFGQEYGYWNRPYQPYEPSHIHVV